MRGNIKFIILTLIISVVFFGTVYVVAKHKSKGEKDWVTEETSATRIEYITNIEPKEELTSNGEGIVSEMSELKEDVKEVLEEEAAEEIEEKIEEVNNDGLVSLGEFCLTAYCACTQCCGAYATGTTASGTTATANRTIAVDTSVIPFGTEVVINGNTYIAEDTGGAIDGNRIDIFFDNHQDALNFGVRYAEVSIRN